MEKLKINNRQKKVLDTDEILISMKDRYFRLYSKENMGTTHTTTLTLDRLEKEIVKRQEELLK